MAKMYETTGSAQTPANPRADSLIQQRRKEFEERIQLEKKLNDRGYKYLLKVNIKNTRERCKICSNLT